MYLKSIEIYGFKSFAEKTHLLFEPGITAIIGPNGCGKSNVSDALRWCLGEQSAKSLRSHQMMDVIFNGSQSRASTGMSEVSLTFDNSQNVLPIDYSEVTVTRRLFRSGESEYFINKTQCRLKDIHDLFLDTGIGTQGYSIIEQGKVEFLLSAKPEQKREMFEEAAGVARYKARREESLKKLEKVDIDMNRVSDMLILLKEQISSLDSQARKAKQYKKCKEELQKLEVSALVHNISDSLKEIEKFENELAPKIKEFEAYNTQLNQTESDIESIRLKQTEKDDVYIKLQDELSSIKSEVNIADERILQARQREQELKERQITINNDIDTGASRIESQNQELEHIKVMCATLFETVEKLEREYNEKNMLVSALRDKLNNMTEEEKSFENRLIEISNNKQSLNNELNKQNTFTTHCQIQIYSLQKDLSRLKEEEAPLKESIAEKEKSAEVFKNNITEIQESHDLLINSLVDLESKKARLHEDITLTRESIASNEAKKQTMLEMEKKNPYRSAIRTVLGFEIPGIRGPLSSLIRINPGFEDIVASALGDKLNYLVCDTVENAQNAIKRLEEANAGRAAFIILERINDGAPTNLTNQVPGAQNLKQLISYDHSLEKVINFVCSDTLIYGNTVYGSAIIQGGGKISADTPLLFDDHMRSLDTEIENSKLKLTANSEEEIQLQKQFEEHKLKKASLDEEHQKVKIKYEVEVNHLLRAKDEIQAIETEILKTQSEIENNMAQEQKAKDIIKEVTDKISIIDNEESDIKNRLEQSALKIKELRSEEEALLPVLTESKVAWATQANELSGRKREEERLIESLDSINTRIRHFKEELKANEAKIYELQNIQNSESEKLKNLYSDQENKEKEVQIILGLRQELLNDLNKKTQLLHELRHKTENFKQEIHNIQLDQRGFELKKQNAISRLTEDFSMAYDIIKDEYANVPVQEEEIQRLKKKIDSIGPVNLAAPEEYSALEERYNFLLTQQQDLLKAKEDLLQVITKINQNTKENFQVTFNQVRENFKTVYQQLFEGGQADIILTDEGNILESGVEILAQPPGKKLQSIALLSGGEKALTAIALLFAFFMVKPSPFCILDEVDAPLDEANVGRYINMVKNFAKTSQFLVITHNKRTMEMADVLYGVTMEELGISKIISVRLQKDTEFAVSA